MNYTLIGTGNVAWFFARRLSDQGHKCLAVYGRNKEAAEKLSTTISTGIVENINDLPESDCCIIAVPDHSIAAISRTIKLTHTTILHTAGSVALEELIQPDKAVLWPVFSINKSNLPEHRNIPLLYEYSSAKAMQDVRTVAHAISDSVQEVSGEQRKWLHLCAVIGNNFTNHLMALCETICKDQGLPFSLIKPIMQQTFETSVALSPTKAQTGPAIRKDLLTQQKHLELLAEHPLWQRIYQSVSASIEDMYKTGKE